jgi:hypothetical protein
MPASGMGQTVGPTSANAATATNAILMSPFSGPTGSPFDAKVITGWNYSGASLGMPIYGAAPTANVNGLPAAAMSTGALSTGIGFGGEHVVGSPFGVMLGGNASGSASQMDPTYFGLQSFTDDSQPGISLPSNSSATLATLLAIGGGKSDATVNGYCPTNPYVAQPLLGFGNGAARDAGAGPVFTGFGEKMVTATGSVANGAAVEAGWVNRSGQTISTGQSVFGSSTTASPAVT